MFFAPFPKPSSAELCSQFSSLRLELVLTSTLSSELLLETPSEVVEDEPFSSEPVESPEEPWERNEIFKSDISSTNWKNNHVGFTL